MADSMLTPVWLCTASVLAGAMNSIAGGGTLLTFPALEQVLGDAKLANGTSTIALLPGSVAGAWGYREEMAHARRWVAILAVPSIIGGIVGTLLVTQFPESYFRALVPWLLLLAATLFLVQPLVARSITPASSPVGGGDGPAAHTVYGVAAFQFFVAVYGGYFGAGIGILMLSSLSLMGLADIHRMNALKTLLAAFINGVSVLIFAGTGYVVWRYALMMAVAAVVGGYGGAVISRRLDRTLVRWVVIVIGFGLAGYYFLK